MQLLKKLTDAFGMPGFESEVREIIKEEIKGHVDSIHVDRMGNLIAVKNSKAKGKHVALSAHMDEVGLVVKSIDSNGFIKFASWGIDKKALVAKTVKVGSQKIQGVIGSKPIHLQKPEEREKPIEISQMYIDIGAKTKEEAAKFVSPGDYIGLDSEFVEFGDNKVKAKAFDDRVGCAAIIKVLQGKTKNKITAVFCVQEEVGLRGSAVAANQIHPDIILNLEGTICADCEDVAEVRRVTVSGAGPAISIMDRSSVYQKKCVDSVIKIAEDNKIPYQIRKGGFGGTDAGSYHTANGGMLVIGIAVPCRYIHTPVSVMDKRDYENMVKLVEKYIEAFNKEDII